MAQKRTVSFRIDPRLVDRLYEASKVYYGKTGTIFASAILMWLEADPAVQGEYFKRIHAAEVDEEVEAATQALLEGATAEQLRRVKARIRQNRMC